MEQRKTLPAVHGAVVVVFRSRGVQLPQQMRTALFLIAGQVVICRFRRFRQPVPRIERRGMLPAQRQVLWPELLFRDRERGQKLVVQLRRRLRLRLILTGDIQRMIVFPAAPQIVRPGKAAVRHPAEALEHTLGEDHVHIVHAMPLAPNVRDLADAQLTEQGFVIHLMHHALDVGKTDLEGVMKSVGIQRMGQLL